MANKTKVAILYDFDKTLCTTDMQNYSFIPSLHIKPDEFWSMCNEVSKDSEMDPLLTYMYLMVRESKARGIKLTRESLNEMGKDVKYFPGVEGWFDRINDYGNNFNVEVEHYVISSGTKEIIEGTSIYSKFKKVFACEFLYVDGEAVWPKSVVNYTNKTQFLFRINKGALDISENEKVNSVIPDDERTIPYTNIIYIADGLTDVPCMKLVKERGGSSIAVYGRGKKPVASKLFNDERVDFIAYADYSDGSNLDNIVKLLIEKMATADKLTKIHQKQDADIGD